MSYFAEPDTHLEALAEAARRNGIPWAEMYAVQRMTRAGWTVKRDHEARAWRWQHVNGAVETWPDGWLVGDEGVREARALAAEAA